MTAGFIIRVILEVVAVLALAYGFIHEDKVVAFEDRMLEKIRARRKNGSKKNLKTDLGEVMQKTGALTMEEREARAREAAYCRNQAAAMRAARAASSKDTLRQVNTSHVA